jgi:hypothetical protein
MEYSDKVKGLLEKYPDLKGDEYHCANCQNIVWCIEWFSQPTSDPEQKDITCHSFDEWARCDVCGKRMDNVGKDYTVWFCPEHPTAERKFWR